MNDAVIREDELQILLNSLDEINVTYPLYEGDILVARPEGIGYSLDLLASRETFQGWLAEYEPIAAELPNYADFLECMLASGVARYANQAAFDAMLTSYGQLKKAVFFGLDTNLFYHGFATNNPEIDHASYLIVETVRDEIAYAINRKYPAKKIEEMVAHAPGLRDYIKELENKRMKRSRKAAYLASERVSHHPRPGDRDRIARPSYAPDGRERSQYCQSAPEVRRGTVCSPGASDSRRLHGGSLHG